MLGRIKSYLKFHPDNISLHSFIIGLVLLFLWIFFAVNGVAAFVFAYAVFAAWSFAPLQWIGLMVIILSTLASAYFMSNLLKEAYPNQSYQFYLRINVPIVAIIIAPVALGLWKLYLHAGFYVP